MGLSTEELFGLPGGMDEVELARSFQPEGDVLAAVTVAGGVERLDGLGGGDELRKLRRRHGEDGKAGEEQESHEARLARSGGGEKGDLTIFIYH